MFHFVGKLRKTGKAVLHFSKACDLASRKQYADAYRNLEAAAASLGKEIGDDDAPFDFNLLASTLKFRLGEYGSCIALANLAIAQIGRDRSIKIINRSYLQHYARKSIRAAAHEIGASGTFDNDRSDTSFDPANLKKVSSEYRDNFPI